eukprot:TRINITY_DN47708_c0_g1_i1.p1 TRINITY_DN47708_c0_g1~~TRINITY_DN47708_c0_g1_i1.p1  ORF type:complete len:367 (+),score=101.39 TRINITY_DN47708_c0_g1_i1:73-1173(+)
MGNAGACVSCCADVQRTRPLFNTIVEEAFPAQAQQRCEYAWAMCSERASRSACGCDGMPAAAAGASAPHERTASFHQELHNAAHAAIYDEAAYGPAVPLSAAGVSCVAAASRATGCAADAGAEAAEEAATTPLRAATVSEAHVFADAALPSPSALQAAEDVVGAKAVDGCQQIATAGTGAIDEEAPWEMPTTGECGEVVWSMPDTERHSEVQSQSMACSSTMRLSVASSGSTSASLPVVGSAQQVVKDFVRTYVKGRNVAVVSVKGGSASCFLSLDRKLTTLSLQRSTKKDAKKRNIGFGEVSEIVVGAEVVDVELPLDELCVTLLLGDGQAVAFRFDDIEERDTFALCLSMFVDGYSKGGRKKTK